MQSLAFPTAASSAIAAAAAAASGCSLGGLVRGRRGARPRRPRRRPRPARASGAQVLDRLEPADRPAELLAHLRVLARRAQHQAATPAASAAARVAARSRTPLRCSRRAAGTRPGPTASSGSARPARGRSRPGRRGRPASRRAGPASNQAPAVGRSAASTTTAGRRAAASEPAVQCPRPAVAGWSRPRVGEQVVSATAARGQDAARRAPWAGPGRGLSARRRCLQRDREVGDRAARAADRPGSASAIAEHAESREPGPDDGASRRLAARLRTATRLHRPRSAGPRRDRVGEGPLPSRMIAIDTGRS